jgi:TonB-dependent SusC/RagA subfamily outer membrane receptor
MVGNYLRRLILQLGFVLGFVAAIGTMVSAQDTRVALESGRTAGEARRVTVDIDQTPLVDAVRAIARQADLMLFCDATLFPAEARVTLHVRQMSVAEAFRLVLRGTGLVSKIGETGNVSIVRDSVVTGTIAGMVSDAATKRPVYKATVSVSGTKWVAQTSDDGAFRVTGVSPGKYTLIVRRIGYTAVQKDVTVTDGETTTITVALSSSATVLEGVVTTVTGPQRRAELGHVVGVIRADSLVKEAPITSISQLLTGRVPGLVVSQGQGTVGGNVNLQIRGQTSLSLSTQPIVIVDGIRYTSNPVVLTQQEPVSPLNDINPNDIETIEVVKGPSAATLYGTDAANGVILITTKHGKAGPPQWSLFVKSDRDAVPQYHYPDSYLGWSAGLPYCNLVGKALGYCSLDSVTVTSSPLNNAGSSLLRAAHSLGYGASVSGGQPTLRYYFAGNYNDLTGPVALPATLARTILQQRGIPRLPDELQHPNVQSLLNLRSNVSVALGRQFDLAVSGGYVHGNTRSIGFEFSPYTIGYSTPNDTAGYTREALYSFGKTSTEENNRFLASANVQGRVLQWLTTRATLGLDAATRDGHQLLARDTTRVFDSEGIVFESRTRQISTSADVGATATISRGPASFRTSFGGQYVRTLDDVLSSEGRNLPPGATSIARAASTTTSQGYEENVTLGSYLEEIVGLNDRLFLTGALRVDGASAFGSGYAAATYPKVSASWIVSQEPFLSRLSGIDELRLRAAIGVSGKQAKPTWALPDYYVFDIPTEAGGGRSVSIGGLGNSQLRPERVREFEGGLDAGLLSQRLQLELTWYNRRTTDQIIFEERPAGLGFAATNLGLTSEHGVETQLTATVLDTRPLHWSVTVQTSKRETKLLRLGNTSAQKYPQGGYVEGYPLGARFAIPLLGYDDANHDGIIVPAEVSLGDSAVYAGPNTAPRTQTLSTTVGLFQRRVRVSALFDRQSGVTLLNDFLNNNCSRCNVDSTTPLGLQALIVAHSVPVPFPGYQYIESGSFTRLREVTAAADFPTRAMKALHLASGSVSLAVRNLALWSHFNAIDPESASILPGDGAFRRNASGIPQGRTWSLRCDIGL